MTAPATFTDAKPSEADSLILRATHLIDRLRGHAERNRFDAPRALKIARNIEANMEISAPTLANLSQPQESALGWCLHEYKEAIAGLLGGEPDRFVTPRVAGRVA